MGVPIGRLICASNENNVLADFIATGVYDISERDFVTTPRPEHGHPHLEQPRAAALRARRRRSGARVDGRARRGRADSKSTATRSASCASCFVGDFVTNDESLATIRRVWDEHRLPARPAHRGGLGGRRAAARRRAGAGGLDRALGQVRRGRAQGPQGLPYAEAPCRRSTTALTGVQLLAEVQEIAPDGACVPKVLAELDGAEVRFTGVVDAGRDGIESAVREWLG